jgi:CheY-like chemotaxis protein
MLIMLQRLIGEDIELVWYPEEQVWPIEIDPSQIDQILANLCVNARDAIGGVGKVVISTANTEFDDAYCTLHRDAIPGQFVELSISDDGSGMDAEILEKIFEPFFSTKAIGRGTGLGLATVYGIVKQNGGFVDVDSAPGRGTSFKIYIPRVIGRSVENLSKKITEVGRGQDETVLLVEDEIAILRLVERLLQQMGYKVLATQSPIEAISLAEQHPGAIDLLLTDVVMPELNGNDLANRLRILFPALGVLFMSGYTANIIAHRGVLDKDVNMIQKPFSKNELSEKIREVLSKSADRQQFLT